MSSTAADPPACLCTRSALPSIPRAEHSGPYGPSTITVTVIPDTARPLLW